MRMINRRYPGAQSLWGSRAVLHHRLGEIRVEQPTGALEMTNEKADDEADHAQGSRSRRAALQRCLVSPRRSR